MMGDNDMNQKKGEKIYGHIDDVGLAEWYKIMGSCSLLKS